MGVFSRLKSYIGRNGIKAAFFRILEGFFELRRDYSYNKRRQESQGTNTVCKGLEREFLLSVLVPAYETEPEYFKRLLLSLKAQTYTNFELIVSDASRSDTVEKLCGFFLAGSDLPFTLKYKHLSSNLGISGNTNAALAEAEGEFITLLDHDDFLEPDSLYETVKALQKGADIVYTDEDKYDGRRRRYFSPNFKPDFDQDLLLSNNYICHLLTVRTSLARKIGGFRSDFDGAQDHDFLLRLSEIVEGKSIVHVPKVLYHWRTSGGSTADNPDSKAYAYENGRRAVQDYFDRMGLEVMVRHDRYRGFYKCDYSGSFVAKEKYIALFDRRLKPEDGDAEKRLAGFLSRPEIGMAGGRIVSSRGSIICNGYRLDECGRRVSLYDKMNANFSGYMHRAALIQEVEAVSRHAAVIRQELRDCLCADSMELCRRVRERGYKVIIDPSVVFFSAPKHGGQ